MFKRKQPTPTLRISEADLRSAFLVWVQRWEQAPPDERAKGLADFAASSFDEQADLFTYYMWTLLTRPKAA